MTVNFPHWILSINGSLWHKATQGVSVLQNSVLWNISGRELCSDLQHIQIRKNSLFLRTWSWHTRNSQRSMMTKTCQIWATTQLLLTLLSEYQCSFKDITFCIVSIVTTSIFRDMIRSYSPPNSMRRKRGGFRIEPKTFSDYSLLCILRESSSVNQGIIP